jgi:lipoprotein NlpD
MSSELIKTFKIRALLFVLAIVFIAVGCAPHYGVYHKVKKGETLWRISRTYGVSYQDVAEVNNIRNPAKIRAGKKIFIPRARAVRRVKVVSSRKGKKRKYEKPPKLIIEKGRFIWPVRGKLISKFGMRAGSMHQGIDIKSSRGTPVRAADSGKVVYSNNKMRGFGNVVILSHKGDFYTVYAHNDKNLVKVAQQVRKGEGIALVGSTGNATTTHLHFEIRHGKKTRNPLFFLP